MSAGSSTDLGPPVFLRADDTGLFRVKSTKMTCGERSPSNRTKPRSRALSAKYDPCQLGRPRRTGLRLMVADRVELPDRIMLLPYGNYSFLAVVTLICLPLSNAPALLTLHSGDIMKTGRQSDAAEITKLAMPWSRIC
jgi:hypothetical protein